jgi:serine/threonine protein kinase
LLSEGSILDERYRIDTKLGEGGMGVVYKAFDLELEKTIALKTLLPQLVGDPGSLRDLRKEVALSQGLNHPNIVGVYHLETRSNIPYITMEYIDGQVFSGYLDEHGSLSEEEFKPFAGQILEAIGYAHERGVIHRDLKPHNMMLDRNGRLLIMDFGIAAAVKETYTRMTGQAITGTVVYMAPEYIRGGDPDKRADIYSLGCIFYEMLSGKPPFWRGEITYQHLSEEPKPLEGVSEALNNAVLNSLRKEPAERIQTIEEFGTELFGEAAIEEKRELKTSRRHRAVMQAKGAVLITASS